MVARVLMAVVLLIALAAITSRPIAVAHAFPPCDFNDDYFTDCTFTTWVGDSGYTCSGSYHDGTRTSIFQHTVFGSCSGAQCGSDYTSGC